METNIFEITCAILISASIANSWSLDVSENIDFRRSRRNEITLSITRCGTKKVFSAPVLKVLQPKCTIISEAMCFKYTPAVLLLLIFVSKVLFSMFYFFSGIFLEELELFSALLGPYLDMANVPLKRLKICRS